MEPTIFLSSWLPVATAVLGGGCGAAVTALVKVILDHKRHKREQTDNVALSLVDTQNERIAALEQAMARERENCDARIEKLERQVDEDRATNDALDMLRRHQVANSKSALHMAIDLIEVAPDRLDQVIPRIRKRLDEHDSIEARDKAAFIAARFGTVAGPERIETERTV
jgi:hypothetical protein